MHSLFLNIFKPSWLNNDLKQSAYCSNTIFEKIIPVMKGLPFEQLSVKSDPPGPSCCLFGQVRQPLVPGPTCLANSSYWLFIYVCLVEQHTSSPDLHNEGSQQGRKIHKWEKQTTVRTVFAVSCCFGWGKFGSAETPHKCYFMYSIEMSVLTYPQSFHILLGHGRLLIKHGKGHFQMLQTFVTLANVSWSGQFRSANVS